jgi:hypothetical protein
MSILPGPTAAELSLYAYPWDVASSTADSFVDSIAAYGVDRISMAVAYHSAEIIAPRRMSNVQISAEANVCHLPLPPRRAEIGEDESPLALPPGSLAREQPRLFAELAASAARSGLGLTGWVVALHNSDLASRFPDTAIENCFGDRSTHGLCPANDEVRRYIVGLATAVAKTGYFDELLMESLSYLLVGHGHPHELWAVRMDPACRALASLCFCPACAKRGVSAGVDVVELRQWTARTLHRLWNSALAGVRDPDEGAELAALTVLNRSLAAMFRMRCEAVTELVGEVAAGVREHGVRLSIGGPVWARPLPLSWLEGIDVSASLAIADSMVLMPYYESTSAVARDVDVAGLFAEPHRFQMVQALWPQHHAGRLGTLLDKITVAQSAGTTRFGLYNYATAPESAVQWISEVAAVVHGLKM